LNSNLLKIKTMHKDFWNPDYSQSLSISIYMATAYSLLMVLVLVIINILLLFFIDISEVTDTIFITFTDYILGVIAAPIIETLILILIIEILKLMKIKNIFINASLAAIPFGFFHVDPITIDDQLLRLIDSVIEFLMTGWAFSSLHTCISNITEIRFQRHLLQLQSRMQFIILYYYPLFLFFIFSHNPNQLFLIEQL
jgi:hypothetical protein